MKEEDNEMRRLSVFIEINGENVYVGDITGKDSTDSCFAYADTYLKNQEYRAISIGLPYRRCDI